MIFKEIFLDLRDSKNKDPHPMWDLFKKEQFQLRCDHVDSLLITEAQKNKLKDLLEDQEKSFKKASRKLNSSSNEELFKELEKDVELFDDQFWLNFLLGVRDQGCHKSSSYQDLPVPVSCSGNVRNMTWSEINTLVTKDYGDILNDQIAVPEGKLETEDRKDLAKSIEKDFEKKVQEKSEEEREKIQKEMKTTTKAKHLHEIRARDAEVKVMNAVLQYCKVRDSLFHYCNLKLTF